MYGEVYILNLFIFFKNESFNKNVQKNTKVGQKGSFSKYGL